MKKKLSKIAAVALAVVMLFGMNLTPLKAAEARAQLCPACSGAMVARKTYGTWYTTGQVRCSHYPYGMDKLMAREVYTKLVCGSCGTGSSNTTVSTQTKKECHGFY